MHSLLYRLSVLTLTLLVCIGLLLPVGVFSAAAVGITSQGFEEFEINNGNFGINTNLDFVHEGSKSLHIKPTAINNQIVNHGAVAADTDSYLTFDVEPGAVYVWTAWVKFTAVDASKQIALYSDYKNQRVATFRIIKASTTDWQKLEITFTAASGGKASTAINTGTAPAECYVDDISVTKVVVPPTSNTSQGFENFEINNGNFGINTNPDFVHEGTKSLHIKPTAINNQIVNHAAVGADADSYLTFDVEPGVEYIWTGWVKFTVVDESKQIALYADYKNQRAATFRTIKASSTDWQKLEITFTAASGGKASTAINTGTAPAECYVDDISVKKATVAPTPQNYSKRDFENGFSPSSMFELTSDPANVYEGAKALHMIGGTYTNTAILNYSTVSNNTDSYLTFAVKPNTRYTWSAWVKFKADEAAAPTIYVYADYATRTQTTAYRTIAPDQNNKGQWAKYTITFTTGSDMTKVSTTVNGGKTPCDMWLDLIELTELGAYDPNADYLQDFESLSPTDFHEPYSLYTAANSGDINVHSGKQSMKMTEGMDAKVLIETWSKVSVKPNTVYIWSVWIRFDSIKGQITVAPDLENRASLGLQIIKPVDTEWHQYNFKVNSSSLQQFLFYFNTSTGLATAYVDDIELKVVKPGVTTEAQSLNYCEDFFNLVPNHSLENALTNDDFGDKTGLTKEIGDAATGDYYLKVTGESGLESVYTIKIPVKSFTEYTLGVTLKGSSTASVGLSFSENGSYITQVGDSSIKAELKASGNSWQRKGVTVMTDGSGYLYLTLKSSGDTIFADNFALFRSDLGYESDPNDYSEQVVFDGKNTVDAAMTIRRLSGGWNDEGDNPSNGDSNIKIVSALIAAMIALAGLYLSKKEVAEHE